MQHQAPFFILCIFVATIIVTILTTDYIPGFGERTTFSTDYKTYELNSDIKQELVSAKRYLDYLRIIDKYNLNHIRRDISFFLNLRKSQDPIAFLDGSM